MREKIDFDEYVTAVSDITNIVSLTHNDEFKLVDNNEKTLAYFHIRKYSVDIYIKDSMSKTLENYERFSSPCKNFSRIYVHSPAELHDSLIVINSDYQKSLKKTKSKKSDTTTKK